MTEKKKVLVVFTDIYLPYSPTTINIINTLQEKGFAVKIIAPLPNRAYSDVKISSLNITYIDPEYSTFLSNLSFLFQRITFKIFSKSKFILLSQKAKLYIKEIKKENSPFVITVDILAHWYAQKAGYKALFLSLELPQKETDILAYEYFNELRNDSFLGVMIQSRKRFNYLFGERQIQIFILPNSPKYSDIKPLTVKRNKFNLLYCGSALNFFGIYTLLDFLTDYEGYTLTIQGAIPIDTKKGIELFYNDLIDQNRLILNNNYLNEDELTAYVSTFSVGFVFYDFYRFSEMRKVNYYTAPSGKLFSYLNAGIPVIGNKLEGFEMIEQSRAGILIENLSSLKIKKALDVIDQEYDSMAQNAKKLSLAYDFNKHILPIIDFIDAQSNKP